MQASVQFTLPSHRTFHRGAPFLRDQCPHSPPHHGCAERIRRAVKHLVQRPGLARNAARRGDSRPRRYCRPAPGDLPATRTFGRRLSLPPAVILRSRLSLPEACMAAPSRVASVALLLFLGNHLADVRPSSFQALSDVQADVLVSDEETVLFCVIRHLSSPWLPDSPVWDGSEQRQLPCG